MPHVLSIDDGCRARIFIFTIEETWIYSIQISLILIGSLTEGRCLFTFEFVSVRVKRLELTISAYIIALTITNLPYMLIIIRYTQSFLPKHLYV